MQLHGVDIAIIAVFFVVSLAIGVLVTRRAGKSASEFFLAGRNMPWWLLGISMVATTFSTDTPNLVTDIVRQNGVSGNWVWWAFLLTGMLTVFVYAKLWRRSNVVTDVEFYELRYSGRPARFLRAFRALYLGVFFNVVIMASVTLAAIKIGQVMLGLTPLQTVMIAAVITVIYSMLGGLAGVLITDCFQFGVAMFGSIMAARVALSQPEVGGLAGLISHSAVVGKLSLLPDFSKPELALTIFIIPLAVQWWSVWYPGSEPGGGGYMVQRMLAAKNENHALGATLLFNIAHYALRPWPWIIVALCSLIVYPDLDSLRTAFPAVSESILKDDMAYPAMMTLLPAGMLGLVLASLIAAYMSTISTHLNWGSSYIVNDFYKRFVKPAASERELVLIGRISTAVLMVLACLLAPYLQHASKAFQMMLQIGAGTGLLYILRWFWWRINATCEIVAMVSSLLLAIYLELIHPATSLPAIPAGGNLVIGVALTTAAWLLTALVTRPTDERVLISFYRTINPGGPGWKQVRGKIKQQDPAFNTEQVWSVPMGIVCMFLGCVMVYGALFATGYWIYGQVALATLLSVITVAAAAGLLGCWAKLRRVGKKMP
jgi:SSS family transporter